MNIEKKLPLYRERMQEIVYRLEVVEAFIRGDTNALYLPTTVECVYLQLRNVLELIATASLAVNDDAMKVFNEKSLRKWHAGDILAAVESVNPNYFYPMPIRLEETDKPNRKVGVDGYRGEWIDFKGDYLTREKFKTLYNICSKTIHISSPYGKNPFIKDTKECRHLLNGAREWRKRIIALIMHHKFMLAGEDNFLHVVHTVSKAGDFRISTFQRMTTVDANSSAEEVAIAREEMLKSLP